jgi:hypothetical protein
MPPDYCGTAEQSDRLRRHGLIVWAAVVQANMLLFRHGKEDAPANVVWSSDSTFENQPEQLLEVAKAIFQLKDTTPDDPKLLETAQTITDEYNGVASLERSEKTDRHGVWGGLFRGTAGDSCLGGG